MSEAESKIDAPGLHLARLPRLPAVALFALAAILFVGAAGHDFTLDSVRVVKEDPRLQSLEVGKIFASEYRDREPDPRSLVAPSSLYRPLTLTWLGVLRGRDTEAPKAGRINLGNIVLHALGVVLRFWLFISLLGALPFATLASFLASLVLAWHPVATEAVCTQVGAAEGLSTVLGTASLLGFVGWITGRSRVGLVAHLSCLLLALLSKESAVAVVAGVLLLAWLPGRRSLRSAVLLSLPAIGMAVVWLLLRYAATGTFVGVGKEVLVGFPPLAQLGTALATVFSYDLPALILPTSLLPMVTLQDIPPASGLLDPRALAGLGLVVALGVGVVLTWKRQANVAFGLLLFACALFPVSNLVLKIGALGASRFLYLPLTGLALALAVGLSRLMSRSGTRPAVPGCVVGGVLAAAGAVVTLIEIPTWKDDLTLYGTAAGRSESSWAFQGHGVYLQGAGRHDEAVEAFEQALNTEEALIPGSELRVEGPLQAMYTAGMNLAAVRASREQWDQARATVARVQELCERGRALMKEGLARINWEVQASLAMGTEAQIMLGESQGVSSESARDELVQRALNCLGEARQLWPANLRAGLLAVRISFLMGKQQDGLEALRKLHRESAPRMAESPTATEIARFLGNLLSRDPATQREGIRIRLDALVRGKKFIKDPRPYFAAGILGVETRDTGIIKMAVLALEEFLRLVPNPESPQARRARQLVSTYRRG